MRGLRSRLDALEGDCSRLIVAKLEAGGDVAALLVANDIVLRPSDLLVRITRPEGVGHDFARVSS